VCQNREVVDQFVVSANVQPTTIDEQCLQGIPKDLLNDVIKLKFGSGFEGLSELIGVAAATVQQQPTTRLKPAVSSAAIMSSEQPSMAESVDSMCFFNQNIMGPNQVTTTTNDADIDHISQQVAKEQPIDDDPEDKEQIEDERSLEQIMGFASDINVQPGDISQNVEDILQVIKSMESAAETGESIGSDHRLSGGCGGLVEAGSTQSTVEGVSEIFPDGEAFALNLLNDMDVMNLVNDNIADSVVADQPSSQPLRQTPTKYTELAKRQAQIERRQHDLERRASFLTRRLLKLKAQLVGEHVAEEATHVLELAQKSAKKCFYQDLASLGPKAGNTRNFPELAGSLGSFLQKVQKSCNAQSNSMAVRQRNTCRYFGAGSKDSYVNITANKIPVFGVPQIKLDGEQVEKVAGPLATKLKFLQSAYDSDCTASSSGGESCDEMQTFNNLHQQSLSISKRAGWRYAQERASLVSRWTWLQAQISDLEYKIRQYNELQRQIRATKGMVILDASPLPPTTAAADSSTVNGYSGALPGSRANCSTTSPDTPPPNYPASRTRPYIRQLYRKRKLFQLDRLHEVSKKAARPATARCSCDGTMAPCAVCTGRKEPTGSQIDMDLLSVPDRIAMVDPGFHPVLSLLDEVPHTVHIDAILRSPEWQQKILRGGMRMVKIKDKDSNERRNKKVSEQRVKYPTQATNSKKSQSISMGARIKRKALKGKRSQGTGERANHGLSSGGGSSRKRNTGGSKVPSTHQQQQQQSTTQSGFDDEEEASVLSGSSKYSSPVPSPLLPNQTAQVPEKSAIKERPNSHSHSRIRQNSYDIDNIVIPYSVAASARLEKLPYKEILIPKWRLCEDPLNTDVKNGAVQKPGLDNDFEDISDETTALRHERGGIEEAKRYEKNSKLPHHSRIRHSRRMESRTDSGANTPDPMSPHASDFGGDTMSPITSPPATPSTPQDTEHSETYHRQTSLQNALRRRTMSSSTSRLQREESNTSVTEEHEQVLPYEPRSFPLTDEDYSKMMEAMPSGYFLPSTAPSVCSQEEEKIDEPDVDSQSDSTESAMCEMEGEDPNDPEWTVAETRDTEKERIRSTAKR
ncbi:KAT8 regulatory NSL complex subunit 1, partial [Phymastichus coffea]|uniref:KAT8 regulatory NSL complex subunit 1 n=1 Tax=Phymastichus coffea TaxID=108790 RepID=UPI00273B32CB